LKDYDISGGGRYKYHLGQLRSMTIMEPYQEEIKSAIYKMKIIVEGIKHYMAEGNGDIEYYVKNAIDILDNLSNLNRYSICEPYKLSKIKYSSTCIKSDIKTLWNTLSITDADVYDKIFRCINLLNYLNEMINIGDRLYGDE